MPTRDPHDHLSVVDLVVRAGPTVLVDHATLRVPAGRLTALVGPSGAGKSLIARSLVGLCPVAPGFVGGHLAWSADGAAGRTPLVGGDPAPLRGRLCAWVPQHAHAALDPLLTVGAIVGPDATTHLARVGLDAQVASLRPHALSGGMATRVAVAAALAVGARFLVVDEPLSGLDPIAAGAVLRALRALADDGHGVLWVTHHRELAQDWADARWRVQAGRVVHDVDVERPPRAPTLGSPPAAGAATRLTLHGASARAPGLPWRRGPTLLSAVDLGLAPGEALAVTGASGSGKTTLLRLMAGLIPCDTGAVRVDGQAPSVHPGVQLLPQDPLGLLHPAVPIGLAVARSARLHGHGDPAALLEALGLTHLAGQRPGQLSGGERRRAALALVLAARPALLLADEPTDGLDGPRRAAALDLLLATRPPGCALVVATHDLSLLPGRFPSALTLAGGRIVERAPPGHGRHEATRALWSATAASAPTRATARGADRPAPSPGDTVSPGGTTCPEP